MSTVRALPQLLAAAALLVLASSSALAEADEPSEGKKPGITEVELSQLKQSELFKQLRAPVPISATPANINTAKTRARQAHERARALVGKGDPTKRYDLILQIGHFPRTSGRTGGTGKHVTEQQMAAFVAVAMEPLLKRMTTTKAGDPKTRRPILFSIIPADDYAAGLKSDIFLSLHTDASKVPCSVGPSVGYQDTGDAKGMHGIALALAITLDLDADKFMRDNYTQALKEYYAYKDIATAKFKGVLEMSELTCDTQERELLLRVDSLAANLARAIQFALR